MSEGERQQFWQSTSEGYPAGLVAGRKEREAEVERLREALEQIRDGLHHDEPALGLLDDIARAALNPIEEQ